jgi:hypothetical protein
MKRVFRIDTGITPEENDILTNDMTQDDRDEADSFVGIESTDDIDEDGFIVSYLICTEEQLEFVKRMADKYKIKIIVHDITTMFLEGIVDIDDREFHKFREDQLKK